MSNEEMNLALRQTDVGNRLNVYEYIWSKVFPNEELIYDDFYDWSRENANKALELALEYCDSTALPLVELKITDMIDWTKVTDNEEVIRLIKERKKIAEQIRAIDKMALVRYELEALQE